ncbi:hypothetical protein BH10BDE1_BH10BDE1_13960 [soil metagenome]
MKISILAIFIALSFMNSRSALAETSTASDKSSDAKCSVLGAAAINVFVYCPSDLTETELVTAAKSFRSQKVEHDQNGVSVFIFDDPNGPKTQSQMVKTSERRIQKIQVAAYMDYPNGESDYFCKRNGKFQNCRGLLKSAR